MLALALLGRGHYLFFQFTKDIFRERSTFIVLAFSAAWSNLMPFAFYWFRIASKACGLCQTH
jgi:hypothetical protein